MRKIKKDKILDTVVGMIAFVGITAAYLLLVTAVLSILALPLYLVWNNWIIEFGSQIPHLPFWGAFCIMSFLGSGINGNNS